MKQLFYEIKDKLLPKDAENIEDFIEHNEFELAFETLCSQLYEYDIPISKEFYEKIILYAESNLIPDQTKELVRRTLLEKVSLNGICRIFNVSMPWLLDFIDEIIRHLPEDLNAEVSGQDEEIEVVKLEADELWSFVGSKKK